MVEQKKKKEKPNYNLFGNIAYALRNIWRWDKAFYAFFIPSIPLRVFLPLAAIYFPKMILDIIENKQPTQTMLSVIFIYFGILFIANNIESFCGARLGMRYFSFAMKYQNLIVEKFMRTDYSNTDNPEINQKYNKIMGDAGIGDPNSGCAPEFIWSSVFHFFINLLGITAYGGIIGSLSPVILILLIISTAVTYLYGRYQIKYAEKNRDKWGVADRKKGYLSGFSSKFEYAKDIRIYSMLGWLTGLFKKYQQERFVWTKKLSLRSYIGGIIGALLTLVRDGTAYFVLCLMLFDNQIGVGDFIFYFAAIAGFSGWLRNIGDDINGIIRKGFMIGYYREYFDLPEKYNHGKGCDLPKNYPLDIEFRNVSYKYPAADDYTLKNLSFKIGKGEKLAIVGANGAGKTTLVKLICGLYFPTEGEILVNGVSTAEYNIEDYYTLFSAVFQDIYLLPVQIRQFIASHYEDIDDENVRASLIEAGLGDKIDSLSKGTKSMMMKGIFDDSVDFSGGERQKLMLARALYKDAPFMILDEPTAALDPIAENEIYLKYDEMTKDKTSVYISHRLASTRFCDRIFFMENGDITEIGSHDELMKTNGKYAYMYDIQSHYYKENVGDSVPFEKEVQENA